MTRRKILLLESFYGGSHRYFADSLRRHSSHDIEIVGLPARHWKWRMRGSPLEFYRRVPSPAGYDLVVATGLTDIAVLRGLWRSGESPPVLLYLHENQISYPLSPGERRDFHYGLTDIANACSAELILFNSDTHMRTFYESLPGFVSRFPDFAPTWVLDGIRAKSSYFHPGIDIPDTAVAEHEKAAGAARNGDAGVSPLILWNHRWEHDKDPETFFRTLFSLADEGHSFRLALLGERYSRYPEIFTEASARLSGRIVRDDYIASRESYLRLLAQSDIVVSTAREENFGISVVEAVRAGCRPVLPARLSYPEIIPPEFHEQVLYRYQEDLHARLSALLRNPAAIAVPALTARMSRFEWPRRIGQLDRILDETAGGGGAAALHGPGRRSRE
jgi:glycosyltransferase involved in cell wall biosynthesis